MTFKLPTPTFITPNTVKILYDLKMKIYSLHLRGLTGIIFFAILAILILTLIAIICDDANDNESQQTTKKSSIKLSEKMIYFTTKVYHKQKPVPNRYWLFSFLNLTCDH